MKSSWTRILLLTAIAAFAASPALQAAEYWGTEELLRQAEANRRIHVGNVPVLPSELGERGAIDYMERFAMVAEFLTTLQVSNDTLPNFGGMMEGEFQTNIIQTDNTAEAIWIWSHYTDLTGDTTYLGNIAAAWSYVMNHPAYNEEGGSGELGYYRVYNSAWAMASEMEYRRVFGDSTYIWYSDSTAHYVLNNPLNLYGPPPYDILNGMVTGWAAGNLYAYGESVGDTLFRSEAAAIGGLVKGWAEGNPAARLGGWNWAMSGGAAFWGVANSYFRRYPEGLRSWSEAYDDYLQNYVTEGNYQNAWNLWFALGHYTAWDTQGDLQRKENHQGIVDYLIGLDVDGDGGIGQNDGSPNYNDQSWVTSYLGYVGLDKLLGVVDLVLIPDTTTVLPGDALSFTSVVVNNTGRTLPADGWADVYMPDGTPFPRNPVLGPFSFNLPGFGSASLTFTQPIPLSTSPGTYGYRGSVGTWPDTVEDSDDALIEVTAGEP